jgi:hypothetical protein
MGRAVALGWIAALIWIGPASAAAMSEQSSQKPAFARIVVSKKTVVYIQIQGNELRAATSVEGLQSGAPVKSGRGAWRSPGEGPFEFALPVAANQLPASVTAIKGILSRSIFAGAESPHPEFYFFGQLLVSRLDNHGAEWQYAACALVPAGASAAEAPEIELPNLDKIRAILEADPSRGKLAIGLQLIASTTTGGTTLTDVLKEGRPAPVKMVVTDASGVEIASKVGTLAEFGFS